MDQNSDNSAQYQSNTTPAAEPTPPTPAPYTPKGGFNKKQLLYFAMVGVVAAALSGALVWGYMSNQNNANAKSLNSQIVTKDSKIATLNKRVSSLSTGTITNSVSSAPTSSGVWESMVEFCDSDGTTSNPVETSMTTLWADTTGKYFGNCSVGLVNSPVGGYMIFVKYVNGQWIKMFSGQNDPTNINDLCKSYSIPSTVDPTCKNNW